MSISIVNILYHTDVVVVGIVVVADYYHYYLHSIVIVIAYALRQSYPNSISFPFAAPLAAWFEPDLPPR